MSKSRIVSFRGVAAKVLVAAVVSSLALLAPATASADSVRITSVTAGDAPVAIQGFTLLKERSGSGRTLRLWLNSSNGLVHGNLTGAGYGDQLIIGSCCYPYPVYETVTSNGNRELNTQEYGNYDPTLNVKFAEGGGFHV